MNMTAWLPRFDCFSAPALRVGITQNTVGAGIATGVRRVVPAGYLGELADLAPEWGDEILSVQPAIAERDATITQVQRKIEVFRIGGWRNGSPSACLPDPLSQR
ncbi:MAG: hypothetical protein ABI129_02140 [Rhodanobacter sp.]